MNSIKNKFLKIFQNKDETKRFLLVLLINILALSPLIVFSHIHYSIDAYVYEVTNDWIVVEWYISSFRYFAALVAGLVSLTGHNPINNPVPDTIFFIITAAVAITILALYLYQLINNKKYSFFVFCAIEFSLLITVANYWYSNILTFSECIVFDAVDLILCFIAIYIFARWETIAGLIVSSILFICAAACFQQFISIFAIYTILILSIKLSQAKEKKNVRQLFFFYLKPCVFIVGNSAIYYLLGIVLQKTLNIQQNNRASLSLDTVLYNSKYFISHQHSFIKGRGGFSTEILTICFLTIALVFVFSLIMYLMKKRKFLVVMLIAMSFAAAYAIAYLPGLVSSPQAANGNRTVCALFSVYALFSIGSIVLYRNKITAVLLCIVVFLVFSLNIYKTVDMEIDQIISNNNDAAYADSISYEIEKHEANTGVTIKKIGFTYDNKADIKSEGLYFDYVAEAILTLHINQEFEFVDVPNTILQEKFSNQDWKCYDADKQIVFIDDSAYICIY